MAIDTSGSDRGLNNIFSHVGMDGDLQPLRGLLTDPTGTTRWRTTEEFYNYINPEAPEAHYERILNIFPDFAEAGPRERPNERRDRAIGKLRQAYRIAQRLSQNFEELPPDAGEDLEAPLAAGTATDLSIKWKSRYSFKVRKEYDPCAKNVAQYHRMCKTPQLWTFVQLEKHMPLDGIKLKSGPHLQEIQMQYDQMRIMANAVAKAGNFEVTCSVLGPNTIMAPLDVNQNYADDAFHKALMMRNPKWLLERDQQTRTLMIAKIKDGMSQGEALRQAWAEETFEWKDSTLNANIGRGTPTRNPFGGNNGKERSPLPRRVKKQKKKNPSSDSDSPPPRGKKGKGAAAKKKAKDKDKKKPKEKFVNMQKSSGKTVCVNWGKGNCDKGDSCELLHGWCNRKLKEGGVCGQNHPGSKCTNPKRVR